MPIDIGRDLNRAVSNLPLNVVNILALIDLQSAVPQVMKPNFSDLRGRKSIGEFVLLK